MAIVTNQQLNDASLDCQHIADIATSTELIAIDRFGQEKKTMTGVIYSLLGFLDRGAWVSSTVYDVKDLVLNSGIYYVCVQAHTSSTLFTTDSSTKWRVYQGVLSGDLAASDGAALIGYILDFVNAVQRTVQSKLREHPSFFDFGAIGDLVANDTLAIQASLVCKTIFMPDSASGFLVSQLTITLQGQRMYGNGYNSIIKASDPTKHLFLLSVKYAEFDNFSLYGAATNDSNPLIFAFFTNSAVTTSSSKFKRLRFSGADSGHGFNNCIKFDSTCNYNDVVDCHVERMKSYAGTGYFVLVGGCTRINVLNCIGIGVDNIGSRHLVYFSAGTTYSTAAYNLCSTFNHAAFTQNVYSPQPKNFGNIFAFNTAFNACTQNQATSGAFEIFGECDNTLLIGNLAQQSGYHGVAVNGTGGVPRNTKIIAHSSNEAYAVGISIISAEGGTLSLSSIRESSQSSAGAFANIDINTDGITATSGWTISGNNSFGLSFARSAITYNGTSPKSTNIIESGNYFPECVSFSREIGAGVYPVIDGDINYSEAGWNPGVIVNGAQSSVKTLTVTGMGAEIGDFVSVIHADQYNHDVNAFGIVTATDTIRCFIVNTSGSSQTVSNGSVSVKLRKAIA